MDKIAQALTDALVKALRESHDELQQIAEAGGDKASGGLLNDVKNLTDIVSNLAPFIGDLAGLFFPPLEVLNAAESAGGKYGIATAIGWWMGNALFQTANPIFLPLQHGVANLAQTDVFDPQTAAQLQAKGIIDDAYGRSDAAGGNLSGDRYDMLVDAQLQRPGLVTLLDLWNRGYIHERDVDLALARDGTPTWWHGPLKQLRYNLLSPADLALANLRGIMSDQEMTDYAAKVGARPEEMRILIGNTGEPPGLMQLLEAYRRNFIDQDTLQRGIRQSRVRDEWIPTIERLRYSPMSIADAIRAVVENYLTDAEGKDIAMQNGLMPDHWEPMKESWGRPLSHLEMMSLYHRGQVTLDQVRQAMRESDLKDKYIDPAIELGRRLVPERQIVMMLERAVIGKDVAMEMLREYGYNDTDAERLMQLGVAQHVAHAKNLTRTDIVNLYSDSLLSKAEANKHLVELGYTAADADYILTLAGVKAKAKALAQIQKGIQAEYRAHNVTKAQAIDQLQHAGMDHPQATALVDLWQHEIRATTRSLTEAQILSLAEHGLISASDARVRLVAYGLTEGDADLLLALHGIVKAP